MELLAPAGNFQSLKAAIASGADAVYLGYDKFGARAAADNFDDALLRQAIELAHLHGVGVYLTVNTLIKDSEMREAVATVTKAYEWGVDAFLVQDLGLVSRLRKELPQAVLHASTQMGICNAYGARFAEKLGIKRVVVARETLPEDIQKIKQDTGLEVEMFCQGALCVAYSGNCYYSSMVSGCSGNRGRCLQLCRKPYTIEGRSGYFLSAKDICLVNEIAQLKSLGIDSLKIEGRMRSPEYVAESVAVYREAIDSLAPPKDAETRLKSVFNRGDYCKAYFFDPTEKVIYSKTQNNIGLPCGNVKAVHGGKAYFGSSAKLSIGDGVKYLRNGIEVGGGTVDGEGCTGYRGAIRVGDEVRLTSIADLKLRASKSEPKIAVNLYVSLNTGKAAQLRAVSEDTEVLVSGGEVQTATKHTLSEQDVRSSIGSLGGTVFELENLYITLSDNSFYPASNIKSLRKLAVDMLKDKILSKYYDRHKSSNSEYSAYTVNWFKYSDNSVFVRISDLSVLSALDFAYDYAILSPCDYSDYMVLRNECEKLDGRAILDLPFLSRGKDVELLTELAELPVAAFMINNVAHFEIFKRKPLIAGIGMNVLNSYFGGSYVDSIEADSDCGGIKYVFGKPPLMHFSHCPRKTFGKTCGDCKGYKYAVKDDKGEKYELRRIRQNYCYGILIPSEPIRSELGNRGIMLDLTYADASDINAANRLMSGKCLQLVRRRKLQ